MAQTPGIINIHPGAAMTTVTEVRTQELTNDLSISRQSPHYMEIYRPQRGPLVPVRENM